MINNYLFPTASYRSISLNLWHGPGEECVKEGGEGLAEAEDEAGCAFEQEKQAGGERNEEKKYFIASEQ